MVVYRLLDQAVAAELVSATIQHKVAPYVKRHALNLDAVLLDYIKVSTLFVTLTLMASILLPALSLPVSSFVYWSL